MSDETDFLVPELQRRWPEAAKLLQNFDHPEMALLAEVLAFWRWQEIKRREKYNKDQRNMLTHNTASSHDVRRRGKKHDTQK